MPELSEIDLVELARSYGHHLIEAGDEWKLLCPFHLDTEPSLYITPENGLWICFGCGKGGSAIQWVAYEEHRSFAGAAEKLGIELNPLYELKDRIRHIGETNDTTLQREYQLATIASLARRLRPTFGFEKTEELLKTFDEESDLYKREQLLKNLTETASARRTPLIGFEWENHSALS